MTQLDGCQLPGLPRMSEGLVEVVEPQSIIQRVKRILAKPWNSIVKMALKRTYRLAMKFAVRTGFRKKKVLPIPVSGDPTAHLQARDWVRVRSKEAIDFTLDPFKELKGCAFLDYMEPYCGTIQQVLKPVERFLDERDYKVKKSKGVVLLAGAICQGTPVFGRCDRGCHLFWREEWLEKVEGPSSQ